MFEQNNRTETEQLLLVRYTADMLRYAAYMLLLKRMMTFVLEIHPIGYVTFFLVQRFFFRFPQI